MCVALLALFVALGGVSYAVTLPKGSVGTAQLKNGAVTKAKISKATRKALKGNRGSQGPVGPAGAAGPRGDTGPQGAPGLPATRLFAHIDGPFAPAAPTLIAGSGVAKVERNGTQVGQYRVFFDRDLTGCAALAGRLERGAVFLSGGTLVNVTLDANVLRVTIFDREGSLADRDVGVAVFC